MKYCDLHCHTTASDGSDTPAELVKLARDAGLAAIAVTDHDTLEGVKEAIAVGKELGIEVIPGVELSVQFHVGNMHMLGYLIDLDCKELQKVLARVQKARADRNPVILKRLQGLGLPVTMAELEAVAHGGQIGRPHIARLLTEKGYVKSVSQAFELYLKKGAPAYAPKSILTPEQAIGAIHRCGGVAVLAHPFSLGLSRPDDLDGVIADLVHKGLDGIECYYSEHSKEFTDTCLAIAKKYGLIVTGGSDYHGKAKPYIKLGRGKGGLRVPYSCVEAIKGRAGKVLT